ncbi:MAG: hypothetical protein J5902_02105 [Paludibacteraceae bacterium]|nr:hypothetical protein [Paludibacteraceae bacterium]
MKKSNKILLSLFIIVLAGGIGVLAWLYLSQRQELNEMVEQMTIEKEELREEYEDLAIQFDGYQQMDIRNDSLQDLLSREQQRVHDLLEELRVTKATNARRIAELKKELATLRTVMQDYVRQIDSLNRTNARLTEENIRVSQENQQLTRNNEELAQNNAQLSETVSRAAMLEVAGCTLTTLNKRDHKTRMAGQIRKLQFNYTIDKNITCQPGMKDIYIRVTDPEGTLLNEDSTHLFHFESDDIPYSVTQQIEYTGETCEAVCYLAIDETPMKGFYTIDFFCEGNLIGSFPIQVRK